MHAGKRVSAFGCRVEERGGGPGDVAGGPDFVFGDCVLGGGQRLSVVFRSFVLLPPAQPAALGRRLVAAQGPLRVALGRGWGAPRCAFGVREGPSRSRLQQREPQRQQQQQRRRAHLLLQGPPRCCCCCCPELHALPAGRPRAARGRDMDFAALRLHSSRPSPRGAAV